MTKQLEVHGTPFSLYLKSDYAEKCPWWPFNSIQKPKLMAETECLDANKHYQQIICLEKIYNSASYYFIHLCQSNLFQNYLSGINICPSLPSHRITESRDLKGSFGPTSDSKQKSLLQCPTQLASAWPHSIAKQCLNIQLWWKRKHKNRAWKKESMHVHPKDWFC